MCKEISCIMPCITKMIPPTKYFEDTGLITSRLLSEYYKTTDLKDNSLESISRLLFYNTANHHEPIIYLGRYIYFAFPLTSIFIGIDILKMAYKTNSPLGNKIAYTIFGCIAALGLGIIIVAIQLLCAIFICILSPIRSIIIKQKYACCISLEKAIANFLNEL